MEDYVSQVRELRRDWEGMCKSATTLERIAKANELAAQAVLKLAARLEPFVHPDLLEEYQTGCQHGVVSLHAYLESGDQDAPVARIDGVPEVVLEQFATLQEVLAVAIDAQSHERFYGPDLAEDIEARLVWGEETFDLVSESLGILHDLETLPAE